LRHIPHSLPRGPPDERAVAKMHLFPFPPQLHVFIRDWLSANNILLKGPDGHVLIDTGYVRHAPLTRALIESPRGIGEEPLAWIGNTHCHSDHVGGNTALAARYGCPIAVPEGEAPLVARWDQKALLYDYCDQQVDRFAVDAALAPGSTHVWGDLEWRAIAAPGHDMGALVFYNPERRILVSGDALWENGFGFVMPVEFDPGAPPATRATIEMLAGIERRRGAPSAWRAGDRSKRESTQRGRPLDLRRAQPLPRPRALEADDETLDSLDRHGGRASNARSRRRTTAARTAASRRRAPSARVP
jgi:glyoxylase-like metal-dependent hydrolase (beta-lactamase superfamily II)